MEGDSASVDNDLQHMARDLSEQCGNHNIRFQADRAQQIEAESEKRDNGQGRG